MYDENDRVVGIRDPHTGTDTDLVTATRAGWEWNGWRSAAIHDQISRVVGGIAAAGDSSSAA